MSIARIKILSVLSKLTMDELFAVLDTLDSAEVTMTEDNGIDALVIEIPHIVGYPEFTVIDQFRFLLELVTEKLAHDVYHKWARLHKSQPAVKRALNIRNQLWLDIELPPRLRIFENGREYKSPIAARDGTIISADQVKMRMVYNEGRLKHGRDRRAQTEREQQELIKLLAAIESGELQRRLDRFRRGEAVA